jgi:hypothetical protein
MTTEKSSMTMPAGPDRRRMGYHAWRYRALIATLRRA